MDPHVGLFLFQGIAGSLTSNAEAMEGVDGAIPDLADLFVWSELVVGCAILISLCD